MTSKEFIKAQKELGLDVGNMAQLLGYRRVTTVYEIRSGSRVVPVLAENFLILLLALGDNDRNLVIGFIMSGRKGKLRLTHS